MQKFKDKIQTNELMPTIAQLCGFFAKLCVTACYKFRTVSLSARRGSQRNLYSTPGKT